MRTFFFFILLSLFYSNCFAQSFGVDSEALLEAGAGVVYGSVPHYPGSDQSNTLVVPFPVVIYRGERLRIDEDGGVRTRFFYSDRFELNLSVGGSLPVSTKDNRVRTGMPKLDAIVEIGPGLIIHLVDKKLSEKFRLSLNIPIRQAISSDLKYTKARGQTFNPLLYSFYMLNKNFTIFSAISSFWASKEYNRYLYDVDSKYATPSRPAYLAKSGHVVMNYAAAVVYNLEKLSVFSAISLNDASRSSNRFSPLFVKARNIGYAIGFTYYFYKIY